MRRSMLLIALMLAAGSLSAAPDLAARYDEGLRTFRAKDYARAAAAFRDVVSRDEKDPLTPRARYFLARSLMKTREFREASKELMAIYALSPSFYDEWSCDFLLGQCRRALGED